MAQYASRTMYYRRAQWEDRHDDQTLQAVLVREHEDKPATLQRTFVYLEGHNICGVDWASREGAFFGRVVRYMPGQATSVISQPSQTATIEAEELQPPADKDFVAGDVFFVVRGNHVTLCSTNTSEAVLLHYFDKLIVMPNPEQSVLAVLRLCPVVPFSPHQVLREGINRITLRSTVLQATLHRMDQVEEPGTELARFFGKIGEALRGVIGNASLEDMDKAGGDEDISLNITLAADGRKQSAALSYDRLATWFEPLTGEGSDFVITTASGVTFKPGELKIQKQIKLPVKGSTTERQATWDGLRNYLDDLEQSGDLQT